MSSQPRLIAHSIDAIHYKIMELIKGFPPGKVLDFPSGWGRLSFWLKEKGHDVTACDISIARYADSPIKHVFGNLNERFPFEDNLYDYAFCIDGPEHAENLYHTFREFYRVLKPGGYLILSIPNYSNLNARVRQLWYGVVEPVSSKEDFRNSKWGTGEMHINRPSFPMLQMALEAAEFSITEVTYDKEKFKQKLGYPIYLLIQLFTVLRGKIGEKKYRLKSSNQKNVLLGGNTLILICRKT